MIKIVGKGEPSQVVCDCKGDSFDKWVDKLLVGISKYGNGIRVSVYCPFCDSSKFFDITPELKVQERDI
jgi:hypothetical protein